MSDSYYEDLSVGQIHDRGQIINLGGYWRDVRIKLDSGNPTYKGVHHLHNAATSDSNWEIWKFTMTATDIRIEGPLPGAWDDRAELSWGA